MVLGRIVEKVSGLSFPQFLRKNVFRPLRMKETVAHQAYGYSQREGSFVRTDRSAASALLGDSGVYSSLDDLRKWDRALERYRLVKEDTWRQAVTPGVLSTGELTEYGFGWELTRHRGRTTWSHEGSTIGFAAYIARFPDNGLTVIVLLNRTDIHPRKLALQIADLFL